MKLRRWHSILLVMLLIIIQGTSLWVYRNIESRNADRIANKQLWSTLEGEASDRLVVSSKNPVVNQHFINQHEQLNEVIVVFYHCLEPDSGKVWVRIKDLEGNSHYEYSFEPLYMQQDVFCLTAHPEEGITFARNGEYSIEISVENMDADDYIEVGTTLNNSKPSIFTKMENGKTLFTKLDYTYVNMRDVDKNTETALWLCITIDALLALLFLAFVWKKRKLALVILAVGAVSIIGIGVYNYYIECHRWYRQNSYVVHAMGRIGEKSKTNSLEAFELSYEGGHKVFEVDFEMTADRKIVLKHDWYKPYGLPQFESGTIPTLEEFKAAKIWEKYTTLDIDDLLQLMLEYPDIYIVTDSKATNYDDVTEQFQQIAEILADYPDGQRKSIMDRLIIQLYNDDMYTAIENIMHFDHYIYTLYKRGYANLEQLTEFCLDNDIPVVVIPREWWTEEINEVLHSQGLEVWVHTLNDLEIIEAMRNSGVDGIYTDVTVLEELVPFE